MKFIITESKFEHIVFNYLDNQDFIKIEKDNVVYFVNSVDDKYAQIKYTKNNGWCYIHLDLIDEISSFFSLNFRDSMGLIGKWVENTLQMKVSNTPSLFLDKHRLVENTLQMRVSFVWQSA